jgi:cellulose biosynthesis protein BcsQ
MGHIITIMNNKGGCGKTTTTVNLAEALANRGKKVLVIDMDTQCNATSILMKPNAPQKKSLYDLLENNGEPEEDIYNYIRLAKGEKLWLLPNIPDTTVLEPGLIVEAPNSFYTLRNLVRDNIVKSFDIALIDNPPNMGTFVFLSLFTSDFAIVPIEAGSLFSIEGLIKAFEHINNIKDNYNSDLRFLRLLINKLDRRTSIAKEGKNRLQESFGNNMIFQTTIPINTTFQQSEAYGETIFQFDRNKAGAIAFRSLAKELISILENDNEKQ